MKPSMFGRERRERLLNDGVCSEGNVLALSTVNKGIKNKLRMSYKKLSVTSRESQSGVIKNKLRMSYKKLGVTSRESQSDVNLENCSEYLELTSRIDPCKLQLFDESSMVKTTVNHQYGNSFVGQRAIEV